MDFALLPNLDLTNLTAALHQLKAAPGDTFFLCIAESEKMELSELHKICSSFSCKIVGGVFPGLVLGTRQLRSGAIIKRLPPDVCPVVVQNLDDARQMRINLREQLRNLPNYPTCITVVDGLSSGISDFLFELHSMRGGSCQFLGGGAGHLDLVRRPCILGPEGLYQDAALLVLLDLKASCSARHGWTMLDGPFVATRSEGHKLYELNWRSAFEVYRESVETNVGFVIRPDHLFEDAKGFPFGMERIGRDNVVRDMIHMETDGSLVLVGEVPENSVINILCGNVKSLVKAGSDAVTDILSTCTQPVSWLIFDCISRVLYLQDDYSKELEAIEHGIHQLQPEAEVTGVMSLGEIASSGSTAIELLNKSLVLAAFE